MKHVAWIILLLNLGVAGVCAEQRQIRMELSGTNAPSTVNLQTGTDTSEYNLAGFGALGQFTLRVVSAGAANPETSNTCSGIYFPILAGEGVLRSPDGSLLKLNLTGGSDCIDPVAQEAHCIRTFQIVGGTGRFRNASGSVVSLVMTVAPVVPTNLQFFAVTGELRGTISGVDMEGSSQRDEQ